jgi:putative transcriptional regulator
MVEAPEEAERDLRIVLGHSGWSAGQLEGELSQGAWLPVAPDAGAIFDGEPIVIWRRVLRSLGDHASGLSDLPPDVSWN